jgi:hypothetical protein
MSRLVIKPVKDLLVFQHKQTRIKRLLPTNLKNRFMIYKYDMWLAYYSLAHNSGRVLETVGALARSQKRVLFYPDIPWQNAVIYQICLLLGYKITNNPNGRFDFVVKWKNATHYTPDPTLLRLDESHTVLNLNCNDISKTRLNAAFEQVFGYTTTVDPLTYHGKCVQKSNLNGRHNGIIVDCPVKAVEPGSIYQILIDNRIDEGNIVDMRVPYFNGLIPAVIFLIKPLKKRFMHYVFSKEKYLIVPVEECFSPVEVEKIKLFCEKIGLDYGELDILRNRADGRIYIVDANNTPGGPPINIGLEGNDPRRESVTLRAETFRKAFVDQE